jgi:REP element-mobilizing transposase RayT
MNLPMSEPKTWGGRRKNAGRKPNAERALVSRKAREEVNGRWPVHVTIRVLPEIPSLRVLNGWVRRALIAGSRRDGFRLIHFAILGNHLHLIAEGDDRVSLSRGIQGLAIRIARAVNQALSRKRGKVFSDRYHEHVLKSPRETKAAVNYLIHNYRKHCAKAGRPLPANFVDQHSSAIYQAGLEANPLPAPRFWFLNPDPKKRKKISRRKPGERSDSIAGKAERNAPELRRLNQVL